MTEERQTDLPGFWRFLWLFWMQPIALHQLLEACGVDPNEGLLSVWRRPRTRADHWWLTRSAQLLLLAMPAVAVVLVLAASVVGLEVDWHGVAFGVAFGVAVGVAFGVAVGVAFGVAGAVAFGVAGGLAGGLAGGVAGGLARGVVVGVAFGVAGVAVVAVGVAGRLAGRLAGTVVIGVFSLAVGFAFDVAGGWAGTVAGTVAGAVAFGVAGVAFLRIPLFIAESVIQGTSYLRRRITARSTLQLSPVLYHELSYLPHPWLERHILAEAECDPILTRRVLEACSIAPGQKRIGRRVEAKLQAREVTRFAKRAEFGAIRDLRGQWLAGIQAASPLLVSFSEAARYAAAAQAAFNPHHRLKHLAGMEEQLKGIESQIRAKRDSFTRPFEDPLAAMQSAASQMREEEQRKAKGVIANPFRVGAALSGEEGPELFRGRESAIRQIEDILADSNNAASLLLLAPRRSGKSSLLKMLPTMLPDAVCVFFDIQAHPIESPGAFWPKLAAEASKQARIQRRIALPAFPAGPPLEAAATWLGELDQLPNGRRVLIAIDEFERLEDLFPGNRQAFLQLMGLFRATIQHRRRVKLLVSGAAPFSELDRVWDDHFISTRHIRLPFLDLSSSVGLLTQPEPAFPSDAIPDAVAREVFARTGGQPYLLQVFGSLLVSHLNDTKRKSAVVDDVATVEPRAIEWAESYFRDTFKSAPPTVQAAIDTLASGGTGPFEPVVQRWLDWRQLIGTDGRLAVPLFGTWLNGLSVVHHVDQRLPFLTPPSA